MSNRTKSIASLKKGIRADIKKYGFVTCGVDDEEFGGPFAYTIGLEESFGHPELLMTGVQPDSARIYFHIFVKQLRSGASIDADDVLDGACNFPMQLRALDSKRAGEAHMLMTEAYYGGSDQFRALQLVLSDRNRLFPWQEGYDYPRQELLFDLDG
jgi:hypothetical protein